jgi:hypothetical protein
MKQSGMESMRAGVTAKDRSKKMVLAIVAVLAIVCAATNAKASCGPTIGMKSPVIGMPIIAAGLGQEEQGTPNPNWSKSIVGLWHTMYTSDGSPFAETLKEWHSDGTEFENVNHNPAIGSVCVGVWKQVNTRTFRLHHLGFLFAADGTPNGTFVVEETDTLADNGLSYTGNFTFRIYDVNGVYTGTEFIGTVAATRITVN